MICEYGWLGYVDIVDSMGRVGKDKIQSIALSVCSWTKFLEHAKSQSICEALSVCQLTSGTLKSPRIKVSVVSDTEFK